MVWFMFGAVSGLIVGGVGMWVFLLWVNRSALGPDK